MGIYLESFKKAMVCDIQQNKQLEHLMAKNAFMQKYMRFVEEAYNKYVYYATIFTNMIRIPKIIHQIWLGGEPMPELLQKISQSWKKMHPDWEYFLWTEQEVAQLKLINQTIFDQEEHPRSKANILRLELLYQFGGLYVDLDFECLKPFDLLHHCCDFYTGLFELHRLSKHKCKVRCNNALIAAVPYHPIIDKMVHELKNFHTKQTIYERTGVDFYNQILIANYQKTPGQNVLLPSNVLYPWKKEKKEIIVFKRPETMAIHWYYTSGLHSQYHRNRLLYLRHMKFGDCERFLTSKI
jgi:mannosyltransferase OCH1-like enzyme